VANLVYPLQEIMLRLRYVVKNQVLPVNQTTVPLIAVLIVGRGLNIPEELKLLYRQEGYLLIEDGMLALINTNCSALSGKINNKTRIIVYAHGIVVDDSHHIDGVPTAFLLEKIVEVNNGIPINVQLFSCFSGAAANDVGDLPNGSVLTAHCPPADMINLSIAFKAILQISQDLSNTNLAEDFIRRFTLYVKQTATIAVILDGGVFQHSVCNPAPMLLVPRDMQEYLGYERAEFIRVYIQNTGSSLDIGGLEGIIEKDAIEWSNDNFLFKASVGDKILEEELENYGSALSDYMTYKDYGSSQTAFMLACNAGKVNVVSAMLLLDVVDTAIINARDNYGKTALMDASINGHANVVKVILDSDKTNLDVISAQCLPRMMTAFMMACLHGRPDVISAMLDSDKVDAVAIGIPDANQITPFMAACSEGHEQVVNVMLASNKVNPDIVNARDLIGMTGFMIAAYRNNTGVVKVMLTSHKVDHNAVTTDGMTAFMIACSKGNEDVVRAMLKSGKVQSTIDQANKQGKTAVLLALEAGHANIALLLRAATIKEADTSSSKHKHAVCSSELDSNKRSKIEFDNRVVELVSANPLAISKRASSSVDAFADMKPTKIQRTQVEAFMPGKSDEVCLGR